MTTPKYSMSISLNVLNHLGINLYSNSVAVITETVANAYDADASYIKITIDKTSNTITIEDDGIGMNEEDINTRFLHIGYDRRKAQPNLTPKGRMPMGRKGLGKLSLFSIAQSIKIYTKKESGSLNAFHIDVSDIEKQINSQDNKLFNYSPDEITPIPVGIFENKTGTKIVLSDLKTSRITSETQLRARLARRFSVIGPKNGFVVTVNDKDISIDDRNYYKKLQYLWVLGDTAYQTQIVTECGSSLIRNILVDPAIPNNASGYSVTGWIGTVAEPKNLDDTDAGNLNGIVLLSRGRIIHENILDTFSDGRLYSKYIIGELNADFLDLDSRPDIATSSRQSLIEDDDRVQILRSHIKTILNQIAINWTDFRNEDGVKEAVNLYPKVDEWLEGFAANSDTKKAAIKIIGHIQSLPVDNINDQKELLKHGIIAFERIRLNDQMSKLDSLLTFDSAQFKAIVDTVDEIEASLYHQIVKERIEIIKTLNNLVQTNALEAEIHLHIWKHLWLLDPSWERAAGSEKMEESVATEFGKITTLSPEEQKGRLDIRYRKSAGAHVIIELKRSERKVTATELYQQGEKYKNGLTKCLTKHNLPAPYIEVIYLLGDKPIETSEGQTEQLLKIINGRYLTYKQIVHAALMTYTDYLEQNKTAGVIREIINSL